MRCTQIVDWFSPTNQHFRDNFLCVPKSSPFIFSWSQLGPIKGKKCIRWLEEDSFRGGFRNTYLCVDFFPMFKITQQNGSTYTGRDLEYIKQIRKSPMAKYLQNFRLKRKMTIILQLFLFLCKFLFDLQQMCLLLHDDFCNKYKVY